MRAAALALLIVLSGCALAAGRGTPKIEEEASNEHPSRHVYCSFEGVQIGILMPAPPLPCAQMGEVLKAR